MSETGDPIRVIYFTDGLATIRYWLASNNEVEHRAPLRWVKNKGDAQVYQKDTCHAAEAFGEYLEARLNEMEVKWMEVKSDVGN